MSLYGRGFYNRSNILSLVKRMTIFASFHLWCRRNRKNMYIVEVDDEMFMLDAGLMFPEDEMLGVDIVIPDIQYVIENKEKLRYLSKPWS